MDNKTSSGTVGHVTGDGARNGNGNGGAGTGTNGGGGGGGGGSSSSRVINGRYEVLEAIGEGPLLEAFRARDRALNRIVAVKTLLPVHAQQPLVLERLRAGLGAVVSLSHASLTRVYDVGQDPDGTMFLAEEYVRGIDLKERIRRVAPFSLTAATDVAIALAEALEYAHARGVIHGDLRPQNVLIGPEGQVKLTGLGTALVQPLLSDANTLLRTVPYSAPDVSQNRTPTVSGDLYALGVTLFEMLTGNMPYNGDGPMQIVLRHAQEPIPSPRVLNPGVPRALEGVVHRALGKRPQDRYGSASEMLTDLRAVRDALRHGKSLSWSPLDRAAPVAAAAVGAAAAPGAAAAAAPLETEAPEEMGTIIAPRRISEAEATIVMPTPTPKERAKRPAPAAAAAVPHAPEPEPQDTRWLGALNLFLLALVLAGCLGLAYMSQFYFRAPKDVIVPNLVGKSLDESRALAKERKFSIEVVEEAVRELEPAGTIYMMNPKAGRHIREGRPVSVWVSRGPKLVEIPDVRDMSVEKARATLEKSGLRVGLIEREFDVLVQKGNVLSQKPEPGETKPRGQKIDLVVSKGEEPAPPPIEPVEEPFPVETPSVESGTGGSGGGTVDATQGRIFTIIYKIPRDDQSHRIRIDITDMEGTRTVYDELRQSGERVEEEVEAFGKKGSITIKLYDNDEMRRELTI